MKKLLLRLSIFAAVVVSIYACRHFLIGTLLEWSLHHYTGEEVAYETKEWNEGKLIYERFSLGENFQAERVTFVCEFNLFPFSINPRIRVKAPLIHLETEKTEPFNFAFLIPTKLYKVRLDVKEGSLSCQDGTLYRFNFEGGLQRNEIGKLSTPFFSCGIAYTEGNLALDLTLEEASIPQLIHLSSFFYPLPEYNTVEGSLTAHLHGVITPDELHTIQGDFKLQETRWESENLVFAVDNARGQIDFQGVMESLALTAQFEGADLFWNNFEVIGGQGSVQFKPAQVPILEATAALNIGDVEGIAAIHGRGEVRSDETVWFEGTLDYTTAHQTPCQIVFSWADDHEMRVLQADIRNMGKEILSLAAKPFFPIQQGNLEGKITTFFDQWTCHRIEFDDLRVDGLVSDAHSIEHLRGSGILNFDAEWNIEQLSLKLAKGATAYQGWKVSDINGDIGIKDNSFEPSTATCQFQGLPAHLSFLGPLSSFHAELKMAAGASQWLQQQVVADELPITLELGIDRHATTLQMAGRVRTSLDAILIQAQTNLETGTIKGDFQSPQLQASSYLPILKMFVPNVALEGDLSCAGHFSNDLVEVIVQGKNLEAKVADFQLSLPGKSHPLIYHYDFSQNQGSGNGKISNLTVTTPYGALSLIDGDFVFDDNSLSCPNLEARYNNLELEGNLTALKNSQWQADFLAKRVDGTLDDIRSFLPPKLQEFQGRFRCIPEGLQVHFNNTLTYKIEALFEDVDGWITSQLGIKKTQFVFATDSTKGEFELRDVSGFLTSLSGETLEFASQISKDADWHFDTTFYQNAQEILSLKGKAIGYELSLSEAKASGSYLKTPLTLLLNAQGKVTQAEGVVYIETAHLSSQLRLAEKMGLLSLTPKVTETLSQLKGGVNLRFQYDEELSNYQFDGSELSYNSTLFHSFQAHLEGQDSQWYLRSCHLDDWNIKGHAAQQKEKWIVPFWEVAYKESLLRGTAIYEKEIFDFQAEGALTPHYHLKGTGLFTASTLQDLNFVITEDAKTIATLSCEKLISKAGKWESSSVDLSLFSEYLDQPLRSKLKVTLGKEITFQGAALEGETKIGKSTLKIGQLFGLYEAPYLNLKCVATLDGEPLQAICKLSKDHKWGGGLQLQHGNDTLKVALSEPSLWQTAQGDLLGLHLDLQRDQNGFKGTVHLKDSFYLAHLTSNDDLQELGGLHLQGIWNKVGTSWGFQGELSGEEAYFKEHLIHELHATVDYAPKQFRLKNITLQDPAGTFTIKECLGYRDTPTDQWSFSIPLIKGQEIKPSGLRKRGEAPKEIKPFLIRNLLLTDVYGQLSDLKSIRGTGSFNFSQRVKKESSLFDIPLTFLKDMGLDLDLFTPVMGEFKLHLSNGKVFFTDLDNAYSEGKRSEFYLAEEPSYIDFNGRLSLNFRMKQNVVLKLVEPFMISVRGTLDKPKYSLLK